MCVTLADCQEKARTGSCQSSAGDELFACFHCPLVSLVFLFPFLPSQWSCPWDEATIPCLSDHSQWHWKWQEGPSVWGLAPCAPACDCTGGWKCRVSAWLSSEDERGEGFHRLLVDLPRHQAQSVRSVGLPINCSLQKLENGSLSVALGAGKSLTFSFSNKQVTWAKVDDLSSLTVS